MARAQMTTNEAAIAEESLTKAHDSVAMAVEDLYRVTRLPGLPQDIREELVKAAAKLQAADRVIRLGRSDCRAEARDATE